MTGVAVRRTGLSMDFSDSIMAQFFVALTSRFHSTFEFYSASRVELVYLNRSKPYTKSEIFRRGAKTCP